MAPEDVHLHVVNGTLALLNGWAEHDAAGVAWAAYDWLSVTQAGMPYVIAGETAAREDARFWAETATPAELECYALASVDKLTGMGGRSGLFASRQIKRLAGALWRRMSPAEQAAFREWIEKDMPNVTG